MVDGSEFDEDMGWADSELVGSGGWIAAVGWGGWIRSESNRIESTGRLDWRHETSQLESSCCEGATHAIGTATRG